MIQLLTISTVYIVHVQQENKISSGTPMHSKIKPVEPSTNRQKTQPFENCLNPLNAESEFIGILVVETLCFNWNRL